MKGAGTADWLAGQGIEVPAESGNTSFNNQYMAYESLPEDLRAAIIDLCVTYQPVMRELRSGARPESGGSVTTFQNLLWLFFRMDPPAPFDGLDFFYDRPRRLLG